MRPISERGEKKSGHPAGHEKPDRPGRIAAGGLCPAGALPPGSLRYVLLMTLK
jgi:hypothetical protein